jgi:site-specific recombinase XerD
MRSNSPREGVPLNIIQRQLGHANLGTTSIYL